MVAVVVRRLWRSTSTAWRRPGWTSRWSAPRMPASGSVVHAPADRSARRGVAGTPGMLADTKRGLVAHRGRGRRSERPPGTDHGAIAVHRGNRTSPARTHDPGLFQPGAARHGHDRQAGSAPAAGGESGGPHHGHPFFTRGFTRRVCHWAWRARRRRCSPSRFWCRRYCCAPPLCRSCAMPASRREWRWRWRSFWPTGRPAWRYGRWPASALDRRHRQRQDAGAISGTPRGPGTGCH